MRIPERWERGFTLIELLIVVAILGVLAAVVIPNVGRFIGRGETEAQTTELSNIQAAVLSMMTDQNVAELPAGFYSSTYTNDMAKFPNPAGTWYVLYQASVNTTTGTRTVNYVAANQTANWYISDQYGTVNQTITAP